MYCVLKPREILTIRQTSHCLTEWQNNQQSIVFILQYRIYWPLIHISPHLKWFYISYVFRFIFIYWIFLLTTQTIMIPVFIIIDIQREYIIYSVWYQNDLYKDATQTTAAKINLYKSIIASHVDYCSSLIFLADNEGRLMLQRL
jgi:hypothetical protein